MSIGCLISISWSQFHSTRTHVVSRRIGKSVPTEPQLVDIHRPSWKKFLSRRWSFATHRLLTSTLSSTLNRVLTLHPISSISEFFFSPKNARPHLLHQRVNEAVFLHQSARDTHSITCERGKSKCSRYAHALERCVPQQKSVFFLASEHVGSEAVFSLVKRIPVMFQRKHNIISNAFMASASATAPSSPISLPSRYRDFMV